MRNALIGYSGFVGRTLLKQTTFTDLYRSNNIDTITGGNFNLVVCAGASAKKWLANKNPEEDEKNIDALIAKLKQITCRYFILISTVDVFKYPVDVTESSPIDEIDLHAYGRNRLKLERFVSRHFPQCLIVRLPGLVGPGLVKNIIYDFLNDNNISAIDSRHIFQFYPIINLWFDIQIALKNRLSLLHLSSEPIMVSDLIRECLGINFHNEISQHLLNYDMKSEHTKLFDSTLKDYHYSRRETIQAVRYYMQSEALHIKAET